MTTVSVQEAQANLPELIDKLRPGEEVVIVKENQPVAKLVGAATTAAQPRKPGSAKGMIAIVAEDDEHLQDFQEYMP